MNYCEPQAPACRDDEHHATVHPHCHHSHGLMGDRNGHAETSSGRRLLFTLALNLLIPIAQVVGGLLARSVALISDATHNFSDFTAILIAYVAHRIGRKGATPKNTFGYRRVEIMAALLNVVVLLGATAFIVLQAIHRLRHPQGVNGMLVMCIAGIGVLGNGLSALLLHRDSKHSLNVRGAFLHMLGDLLTSVAVVVSGFILLFRPWNWLDPLLSLIIVVFILKNCWEILREAVAILMNATPKGLDINKVKEVIEDVPGVCTVHYLHAWSVSSRSIAFSCHVVVKEQPVSESETLGETIRAKLLSHFGIDHTVLQFETVPCGNGTLLCEIYCGGN